MLERFLKEGRSVIEIAGIFGKGRTTVYDEIRRGCVELLNTDLTTSVVYLADVAQRKADEAKEMKGRPLKIGNDYALAEYLDQKLGKEKYSPAAVYHEMERSGQEFSVKLCIRTIFNYAKNGVLAETNYIKSRKKKKHNHKRKVALHNVTDKIIEKRPEEVDDRDDLGHWEMDTVVSGRGDKTCLLVLTERKSRKEIIRKIENKMASSVVTELDKLEKQFGKKKFRETFKTITVDNGVEFMDDLGMEKDGRTHIYYCHPYASYERGSNENANKLIRRWIPKGAHIGKLSKKFIQQIEDWMNNYPRQLLGWKTANDVYFGL